MFELLNEGAGEPNTLADVPNAISRNVRVLRVAVLLARVQLETGAMLCVSETTETDNL